MSKIVAFIFIIVFLVLGVTIGLLNPVEVPVNLFLLQPSIPLSVVMAVMFILGMLIGASIVFTKILRLQWTLKKLQHEKQKLSNQLIQLKKNHLQEKEQSILAENTSTQSSNEIANIKS